MIIYGAFYAGTTLSNEELLLAMESFESPTGDVGGKRLVLILYNF